MSSRAIYRPDDYGTRECTCGTTLRNVVNPRNGELVGWSCLHCWKSYWPREELLAQMRAEVTDRAALASPA